MRRRIWDAAPRPDARQAEAPEAVRVRRACRRMAPVTVVARLATDLGAGADASAAPRRRAALMGSGSRACRGAAAGREGAAPPCVGARGRTPMPRR